MINQIELSEQFEKIFTDKEVHDFYLKWHESKIKKEPKKLKDKIFGVLCYLFVVIIVGIGIFSVWNISKDQVEQEVRNGSFVTYVWKDQNIIKSWYTPIDSVTDSIKTAQYKAGKELLKLLK